MGGEYFKASVTTASANRPDHLAPNPNCWQVTPDGKSWKFVTSFPKDMQIRWQALASTAWGFIILGGKTKAITTGPSGRPVSIKSKKCYHFSFENNRWNRLPDMISPRAAASAVSLGTMVYVLGGLGDDGLPLDLCESLDINRSQSWHKHASMVPEMYFPITATCQGKIWVIFNTYNLDEKKKHAACRIILQCFNPPENRWRFKSDLPEIKDTIGAIAAGHEDSLYVVGGMEQFLARYDITFDSWNMLEMPKLPRQYPSMLISNGYIFLFGGHVYKQGNSIFIYNASLQY